MSSIAKALSEGFAKHTTFENGNFSTDIDKVIEGNLPKGVTPEIRKAVHKFDQELSDAGYEYFVKQSETQFNEDHSLNSLTTSYGIGDNIQQTLSASRNGEAMDVVRELEYSTMRGSQIAKMSGDVVLAALAEAA